MIDLPPPPASGLGPDIAAHERLSGGIVGVVPHSVGGKAVAGCIEVQLGAPDPRHDRIAVGHEVTGKS